MSQCSSAIPWRRIQYTSGMSSRLECVVWLAEVAGHLAGLLAIKDDYIDQLFVAVGLQRQGVGTALLLKAREHSPHRLRLYTFQKNAPARAFYEKHGFKAMRFGDSPAPE